MRGCLAIDMRGFGTRLIGECLEQVLIDADACGLGEELIEGEHLAIETGNGREVYGWALVTAEIWHPQIARDDLGVALLVLALDLHAETLGHGTQRQFHAIPRLGLIEEEEHASTARLGAGDYGWQANGSDLSRHGDSAAGRIEVMIEGHP